MKVLSVSKDGSSVAIPERFYEEKRYAFFHGGGAKPGEQFSPGAYVLRLSKNSFPVGGDHNWLKIEYSLVLAHGYESDEMGNPIYAARRSFQSQRSGECLCLLDMCQGQRGGFAILSSWNEQVTILGKGVEKRTIQLKRGGARCSHEIEYPVLQCLPGARFEWITNSLNHGTNHSDYRAEWDGEKFIVAKALAVTQFMEDQHRAEQAERKLALKWRV